MLLFVTGARYETANFSVDAPNADSAKQFAESAEQFRYDLAIRWLGNSLPDWSEKCPVKVHLDRRLGAGGATSFIFENNEVFGWEMEIQGSHERILDSVLPHEITHMVLASHFRKPIPRWLDEGMATSVEHPSEKENYRQMLRHFLQSDVQRCYPLNRMVAMEDYPSDAMPFYAQGFSLVDFLLEKGGQWDQNEHGRLIHFTQYVLESGNWQSALQEYYQIDNLGDMQIGWLEWVDANRPVERALPMTAEASAQLYVPSSHVAVPSAELPIVSISARPPSSK